MKQEIINHEVLLLTGTHFSKRQFCEKSRDRADDSYSSCLQDACWNGLVFEILPGFKSPFEKNSGYTWEVVPAESFIEVKIGATPYDIERSISLNPHLFLSEKNIN